MSAIYQIYPMYLGEIPNHKRTNFTYLHNQQVLCRCPFMAFLLKGDNGKNILVDTGPCSEEWALKYHMPILAPAEAHILEVLKKDFNLEPGDVDYIINTHLHWDHSFGNTLFPGKDIYVQRIELLYAINPLPIYRLTYESPQTGIVPNWLLASNQFKIVDGDVNIDDGIRLVLLPGHAPGMQGVVVDTAKGKYLLGSDLINCYEQWEGDGVFPYIVPGLHSDLQACFDSFEKVRKMVAEEDITVLPGHDEKVLEHKVYPFD